MFSQILKFFLALSLVAFLTNCSNKREYTYPKDKMGKDIERMGSLVSDDPDGGFSLFSGNKKRNATEVNNVNNFLWRAAIETISFMPINSTDSKGGIILTDWYVDDKNPNEQYKLNIAILDSALAPNSLQISIFKRANKNGKFTNVKASEALKEEFENRILTRARELKVAFSQ